MVRVYKWCFQIIKITKKIRVKESTQSKYVFTFSKLTETNAEVYKIKVGWALAVDGIFCHHYSQS